MKTYISIVLLFQPIRIITKKKQIAISVLSLLISINLNAQNMNSFYFDVNSANNLAESGKVDSAILKYENAFKNVQYVPVTYLRKVLKLSKSTRDKERIKHYSKRIKIQNKGTDPHLKATIDSLVKVDQKVRKRKSVRISRYSWDCDRDPECNKQSAKYKKSKRAIEHWMKTDSLNTYFLLDLFEKHGFIGEELVGFKGYLSVWGILLHFDADTSNTVLEPVLTKALNEGKISPIHFAYILDRHLSGDNTKQKYWLWPDKNKEKYAFMENEIPQILKLRESIGIYGSGLKQEKRGNYWVIRNTYFY